MLERFKSTNETILIMGCRIYENKKNNRGEQSICNYPLYINELHASNKVLGGSIYQNKR